MNKIKNAVIIHGPGRSGTTLLSNILSLHKDFYWISGYVSKYPNLPVLSFINNFQRIDAFEEFNRGKKKFPRPSEAYGFWKNYFEQFNVSNGKPQINEDKNVIKTINKIKNYSFGNRFITKLTGDARFDFIDSVFENPTIIWIDRKPESVVMSYYKQRWNYKSKLDEFKKKPKTELIQEYCNKFKSINEQKQQLLKYNFQQVYYEDLAENPLVFFSKLCDKLNLEMNEAFSDKIKNWNIYQGSNDAYKKDLNVEELLFLERELFDVSKELGYKQK